MGTRSLSRTRRQRREMKAHTRVVGGTWMEMVHYSRVEKRLPDVGFEIMRSTSSR